MKKFVLLLLLSASHLVFAQPDPSDTCDDLANIDFGDCEIILGYGIVNGTCQSITGCNYIVEDIDYSSFFHPNLEACQYYCQNDDCIDLSLINPELTCPIDYIPVCGCNGVTYLNACIASVVFGISEWTSGECPQVTFSTPCTDLADIDFGSCEMLLGVGIINGTCQEIFGCGYLVNSVDYTESFKGSFEACEVQCLTDTLCFDFEDLNFGICDQILGAGLVDGTCQYITGCSSYLNDVNYTNFFWTNLEDCIDNCESTDCYQPNIIDTDHECSENYFPVCGCDNITYTNECTAYYHYGITEWTNGPCSLTDTSCFDLQNLDFGPCEGSLGIGLINGMCEIISGCGYFVNGVDYSDYFYADTESCMEFCNITDNINSLESIEYTIYPNPVKDVIHLSFTTGRDRTISILTPLGKQIQSIHSNKQFFNINSAFLEPGIYFIEVREANIKTSTKSIVVF